jgi:sucrose phosphorylase
MNTFLKEFAADSFNKIHFLPFYPYSSDDGFAVIDYYQVREDFGTWDDLQSLHASFSLMYDFVLNHVSQSHSMFQKFLAGDVAAGKFFAWFDQEVDTTSVYRPRVNPLLTPFETKDGKKYVWTTFSADQIDLFFNNPEVLIEAIRVLLFYISRGADTIRLDAVGYLWKDRQTRSVHLPQTHMIVKIFREVLESVAPWVWIIPEANAPLEVNLPYFGNGSDEAHLVYNFTLPPLILHSFIAGTAEALTAWAQTLRYPSDTTTFFNFTATHDGIGLQPIKPLLPTQAVQQIADYVMHHGGKINYRATPAGQEPYELNAVYRNAVGSDEKFFASQAIQLALKGVPAIYLNSYIGEENWDEGVEQLGYNRAINRRKFDYTSLTNELRDPNSKKSAVYTRYKHLIKVRRSEPLFSPNAGQEILLLDSRLFVIKRFSQGKILVSLTNVSAEQVVIEHLDRILQKESATDILTGNTFPLQSTPIKPYETLWLK